MFLIRLRHQQAKDVVLGLRESIKEKDDNIEELKNRLAGRKEGGSETSLKETVTGDQVNTVIIFFYPRPLLSDQVLKKYIIFLG